MKIKKRALSFVAVSTLVAIIFAFLYLQNLEEPADTAVAYVSIGLKQSGLPTEVSSYEILRANEHFSDIVLGWTVEPSFAQELEILWGTAYPFFGQRQEKQNLLFEIKGVSSTQPARDFVTALKNRLNDYNAATESSYKVALERYSMIEGERSELRFLLGIALLAFLLSSLGLLFWDYATRH